MRRDQVTSGNLHSVGYDASSNTLEVEFNNGPVYQYFDVPSSEYEALMAAESHGKYFNAQIKGHFRYVRV